MVHLNGKTVPAKVSVIIPTMNEELRVARAVGSATAAGAFETIVADGGSTDRTTEVAAAQGATIVRSSPGRAAQQNAGAAAATGDVLLFLHADNWLAAGAIRQVAAAAGRPSFVAGSFRQQIDSPGLRFRLLEFGNGLRAKYLGAPYGDQSIFVRRASFRQIGGFPETLLMEDLLIMRQLRRQAWPLLLAGPVYVDARRWHKRGVMRQTLTNLWLTAALTCGVNPDRLARFYPRHDAT